MKRRQANNKKGRIKIKRGIIKIWIVKIPIEQIKKVHLQWYIKIMRNIRIKNIKIANQSITLKIRQNLVSLYLPKIMLGYLWSDMCA